ncbi:alpha-L-rhamnosidase [Kiritimatiella glycovorans]|uniref:alpha-L-rhamnosidase n=1 Tax=Kiritimatiella glycovorans TaxID=1307763 RepID=A0A0G3EJ20_9BACT|nr:alpha-L-rhamnosidase [Kiritimatiella glycovorans]AKJ65427.1 Alpha-L-rhamnosidase [Kiritimatiella glycovorans]
MQSERTTVWQGEWIRFGWNPTVPLLRRAFEAPRTLAQARLRATALGICELWLNGERVTDDLFRPGWSDYRKRVYVQEYDLTGRIRPGTNVLGAVLAPGWYAGYIGPFEDKGFYGPEALFSCELHLTGADGATETIVSDESWIGRASPVLRADLLMGEWYDAREEPGDWSASEYEPEFDPGMLTPPGKWGPVAVREPPATVTVEPCPGIPVRAVDELPAVAVHALPNGDHVFDLGQNMVGACRLKLNVPRDTELVLRHGEMLEADGSVYTDNLRAARAEDRYTAKGATDETWQPRFTFHGFRYVQIAGLPVAPPCDTVTGVVFSSVHNRTAEFQCSDPRVNRLFENAWWGFLGNYLEVPTDCPQRDERLGWTGDAQIFMKTATYLSDVRAFYEKWLQDLHDAQRADGAYPDVAPDLERLGHGRAAWGDAGIICPYMLWRTYGELRFAERWWDAMNRYIDYLFTPGNTHNGPNAWSYGDWLNLDSPTPDEYIGKAYRAYDVRLMREMAQALGYHDDEARLAGQERRARDDFRERFLDADGHLAVRTQTAAALAVAFDLLEGDAWQSAANDLAADVEQCGHLTTGFVGTGLLCPALTRSGRHDLAVELLLREDYPSWLYEVKNGATTIWERWNSWSHEHGFGDAAMNSFNHYAFGAVCEWMIESLAGLQPAAPGFGRLRVVPGCTPSLDRVKLSYESPHGLIGVAWEQTDSGYHLLIATPVPAEVHLPDGVQEVDPGEHDFEFGS